MLEDDGLPNFTGISSADLAALMHHARFLRNGTTDKDDIVKFNHIMDVLDIELRSRISKLFPYIR